MTKHINRGFLITAIVVSLLYVVSVSADQDRKTQVSPSAPQAPWEGVQSSPPEKLQQTDRLALQQRNPRYRLSYGDAFELKFPWTPEFDQERVTVQPDGYISLLGAGDLHVEGKTLTELDQALKAAYEKTLHDPVISVKLLEFEKPYFIVGGEVTKPGKYDLRGDTTVAQAVNIAGSFTPKAKHSQVLLFRRVSQEWVKVTKVDLKKMFRKADLTEDQHLHPGDMLWVPESTYSKIKEYIPRPEILLWWAIYK